MPFRKCDRSIPSTRHRFEYPWVLFDCGDAKWRWLGRCYDWTIPPCGTPSRFWLLSFEGVSQRRWVGFRASEGTLLGESIHSLIHRIWLCGALQSSYRDADSCSDEANQRTFDRPGLLTVNQAIRNKNTHLCVVCLHRRCEKRLRDAVGIVAVEQTQIELSQPVAMLHYTWLHESKAYSQALRSFRTCRIAEHYHSSCQNRDLELREWDLEKEKKIELMVRTNR